MTEKFDTLAVHAGQRLRADENDPTVEPITLATVWERPADGAYKNDLIYSRAQNPNRQSLETALAQLEGGEAAAAFASGSAASMAIFQSLAAGDHVICTAGFYGTTNMLRELMQRWGLTFTLLDTSDLAAVAAAFTAKTKLVWLETPTNPMMRVSDIAAIAELAHKAGARLIVDNTVGTPLLQRCFELGADLTMHSTTKYLGGHSDVIGGAVVTRKADDFFGRIRQLQTAGGAVPSPFDCWLLLRGIRTMGLRVPRQSSSALELAQRLSRHKNVERALYPGLGSHPGHEVAKKQMTGFGGLLSILVKGGRAEALAATAKLKLIKRATSLGGVETTIDHRESVESPGAGTPANLLRLSVGIEDVDDLWRDLEQAL